MEKSKIIIIEKTKGLLADSKNRITLDDFVTDQLKEDLKIKLLWKNFQFRIQIHKKMNF